MIDKKQIINFVVDLYIYLERLFATFRIWLIVTTSAMLDRTRAFKYIGQPSAILHNCVIVGVDDDPIVNARTVWWLCVLSMYNVDNSAIEFYISDLKLVFKLSPRFLIFPVSEISDTRMCEIDLVNRKFKYQDVVKSAGLLGIATFRTC